MPIDDSVFDVAILGAGAAGSILGTILARNGLRVLILERGTGPRFAVGESTIPRTSMLLRIMAERYDVPELRALAHFPAGDAARHGIKRNFGFVHHVEGEPQRPSDVYQTIVPEARYGAESHLFRADFDRRCLDGAIRYGAVAREGVDVVDHVLGTDGVELVTDGGERHRARFLVDATGARSRFARQHGLRASPDDLATATRSIFTHARGVPPYDDVHDGARGVSVPRPWNQGTLHHVFDGGWFWVIPFDNHEEARNPLCSIGLTLDCRRHPATGEAPEDEFAAFARRFPGVERHLRSAEPERPWIGTSRLQYTSSRRAGGRFCLLPHAAGFIDPLFSRGLANSMLVVAALAHRLIDAARDDDFSDERFAYLDALQASLIESDDRLVACAYASWRCHRLWNAYVRVWALGAYLDWLRLSRVCEDGRRDAAAFARLEGVDGSGSLCPGLSGFGALFDAASTEVERVRDEGADGDAAADRVLSLIAASPVVPPVLELADPARRHDRVLDQANMLELFRWIRSDSPDEWRRLYFGDDGTNGR